MNKITHTQPTPQTPDILDKAKTFVTEGCNYDSYFMCGVEGFGKGIVAGASVSAAVITSPFWGPVALLSGCDSADKVGTPVGLEAEGDADNGALDSNDAQTNDTNWFDVDALLNDIAKVDEDVQDVQDTPDSLIIDADKDGIADESDTFIAADDGSTVEDADGGGIADEEDTLISADAPDVEDVTPAQDATEVEGGVIQPEEVSQGDGTDTVADTIEVQEDVILPGEVSQGDAGVDADISEPLVPTCLAVEASITCDDGSKNVAINYIVQGATKFMCDSVGAIDIADAATKTVETVSLAVCATGPFDDNCKAINDKGNAPAAQCPGVDVTAKKPNTPPIMKSLNAPLGVGILPSGDQSFNINNKISFSFTATDADNDPLKCTLDVSTNNKVVASVSWPFADLSKPLTIDLSANLFLPTTDYSWNVSCDDGKGGIAAAGASAVFTTSEKGLIGWWRFDEGQGNVALDSSGNGIDGLLMDFDLANAWVKTPTGGGLFFDGIKSYIQTNSPATWNTLDTVSTVVTFSNAFPLDDHAVLIDKLGEGSKRLALEFFPNKTLLFGSCAQSVNCALGNIPQSTTAFDNNVWNTVLGVYDGDSAKLFVNAIPESSKQYAPAGGPMVTTEKFLMGRWTSGGRFYHGTMDDVKIYDVSIAK